MTAKLENLGVVAMRAAIRKDKRAKQWAKVNCEDNFCLAIYHTAESALLDVVLASIDDPETVKWFNEACSTGNKLKSFVLTTCREMYKVLRNEPTRSKSTS